MSGGRPAWARRALCLPACAVAASVALAQAPASPSAGGATKKGLSPLPELSGLEHCSLSFGRTRPVSGNVQEFSGYVDLDCQDPRGQDLRIQADTLTYDRETKQVEAEGNVALSWAGNRLAGSSLHYDVVKDTGWVDQAVGTFPPDAVVVADRMEKISRDEVVIHNGVFTSCTQPVPYWSFRIRRGRFHLGHYAYLHGVSMRARRLPIFYSPFLVWPIKGDRATGLLFPQWGFSQTLGAYAGDAYFWAIAGNADATFYGDYYELAGPAAGIELNWLPSERGKIEFDAYGLHDRRTDERRYKAQLRAEQRFEGGWKAVADLNDVSDFKYYTDFERSLTASSNPATVSTFNLTNNWSYYSFAARAQSREQFFTNEIILASPIGLIRQRTLREDLTLETRPEIELRGRSRKLGPLPLYLSFESSLDFFGKRDRGFVDLTPDGTANATFETVFDTEYKRGDLGSRLSLPMTPLPWLDIEAALTLRETFYTKSQFVGSGGAVALDDSLHREFAAGSLELTGPKFFRVFEPGEGGSRRFKHVIEPFVDWQYSPELDYRETVKDPTTGASLTSIIPFDEIDFQFNSFDKSHQVTYGIRQRLFARRPPAPIVTAAKPEQGAAGPPWGPASIVPAPPQASPAPPIVHYPQTEGDGTRQAPSEEPSQPAAPLQAGLTPSTGAAWPFTPSEAPSPTSTAAGIPAYAAGAAPTDNPVEIASLEISQRYSFTSFLSSSLAKGNARVDFAGNTEINPCSGIRIFEETTDRVRHTGPVSVAARLNPSVNLSFDLRSEYDPLRKGVTSNILSTSARSGRFGYANLSWVRLRAASSEDCPTSTMNFSGGTALLSRRLTLDVQANYDQKASRLLDRGVRVGYYTQCCGFFTEYSQRRFLGNERREIRFVVDLKGIGKFLDLNRGSGL